MSNSLRRLLFVWLLILAAVTNTMAHPKISPDLERAAPDRPVNVIVQYKLGRPLRTILGSVTDLVQQLPLVGAVVFRILPLEALAIANDPDVEYVSLDRPIAAKMDLSAAAVNANLAFAAGTTGNGITVAVIDSGIANHPDVKSGGLLLGLLPRVIYQESFVPGDP